jgi:hypothetical protein
VLRVGGEGDPDWKRALELRMPHRACCNLYDIIRRRAPRAKKGAAVLAAVPDESQDFEDQILIAFQSAVLVVFVRLL